MRGKKADNVSRDYDKEPLTIGDNFTSLVFSITFWLIINGLIIYLVFFGDAIDWSQNKDWIEILKDEIRQSHRFSGVVIGFIVTNLLAFLSFYKNLKNPRKIVLTNEYIKKDKNFNDLEYLKLEDILEIKKSFLPLLGTGKVKGNYLGILIGVIFLLISVLFMWLFKIILWIISLILFQKRIFLSMTPYIIIFSKNTYKVLNIHLLLKQDYEDVKKYFSDTLDIDINKVQINFKLSNTQGVTNAR